MDIFTILGIAIGLGIDCFSVAVSTGTGTKKITKITPLIMAVLFGFFQFSMAFSGWYFASLFKNFIESFDHWIAFLLLFLIGIKMIKESFEKEDKEDKKTDFTSFKILIIFSFATSIDSLAVGISFSLININIFLPAVIIGITSFLMTLIGFFTGKKIGEIFEKKAELAGGLILIIIGVKILFEHIFG